nr:MAG TPA: Membrane fusion protein p14 fusion protein transmembrane domain [Caudoviricetes sp.]
MEKKNLDIDIQEINRRYEVKSLRKIVRIQRRRIESLEIKLYGLCIAITLLGVVFWLVKYFNS